MCGGLKEPESKMKWTINGSVVLIFLFIIGDVVVVEVCSDFRSEFDVDFAFKIFERFFSNFDVSKWFVM